MIGALNIKLPEKEVPAEESGSDQEEEGSESEAGTEDEVLQDLHTGYLREEGGERKVAGNQA